MFEQILGYEIQKKVLLRNLMNPSLKVCQETKYSNIKGSVVYGKRYVFLWEVYSHVDIQMLIESGNIYWLVNTILSDALARHGQGKGLLSWDIYNMLNNKLT